MPRQMYEQRWTSTLRKVRVTSSSRYGLLTYLQACGFASEPGKVAAAAHARTPGGGLAETRPAQPFAPLVDCARHAGRGRIRSGGERADVRGSDTIGDGRGLRRHPCVSCLNVAAGGGAGCVGGCRNESSHDEGQSGHRFSPHGDESRTSSAPKNQVQ
jgi:hypothetical protein